MLTLIHAASLGFSTLPGKSTHHDEKMCPSEMPPPAYTGPVDAVIDGRSTSCLETEINCYNRYSPHIPMAMTVPSGSVVEFHTRDLWCAPGPARALLRGPIVTHEPPARRQGSPGLGPRLPHGQAGRRREL